MRLIFSILLVFIFSKNIIAQVNINNGLVAYFPFNGNANDESGNDNNPIFNNASLTNDKFGKSKSAYHFNGKNNYIKIPNSNSLQIGNKVTLSMRIKVTGFYKGLCKGNSLIMKGNTDYLEGNMLLRISDFVSGCGTSNSTNNEQIYGGSYTGAAVAAKPIVEVNKWYDIAYTFDGFTHKIYINCLLEGKSFDNNRGDFNNFYDLFLGRMNNDQYPYWFNGDMDEVRIYNRALNEAEILALCDKPKVKEITDQSADIEYRITPCNKWLSTPNIGSYVTVGDLDITGNQVTVEANFNRSEPLNKNLYYGHLVSKHSGVSDANYTLLPNGCEITTSKGYFSTFQSCPPELNKTYHVAMVYNGSTLKFYRNGFLLSSQACSGNLVTNNFETTINQYAALTLFNNQMIGYTNEVRIWNIARTQEEIKTYMNTALPNPTTQAGLKAYYTFDDLNNKQGNAKFNGKLNGDAVINATNPNCDFVADSCIVLKESNCNNWLSTPSIGSAINLGDLDISENQITVEATINRTQPFVSGIGNNNEGDVVSKHTGPANVNYLLRPNHAYITTSDGFFGTPDICDVQLNKTYHIAMTYDGTKLKFYRNGFLLSQVNATGKLFQNNFNTKIGLYDIPAFSTQFLGYINEVRIWNIARTQTELQTYMNKSLPNPTTQVGLKGYYVFDDLTNKQGNAKFNGKLNGDAVINATNPNCNFVADSCVVVEENKKLILEVDGEIEYSISKCNEIKFSVANQKNVTEVKWNFGDNEISFRESVTHIYKENKKYLVSLTLYGKDEQTKTITKEIIIQSPSTNFSYKQINNSLKIEFKNTSADNLKYYWDFGDGEKSITNDKKNEIHEYAKSGTYTIKLRTEDKMGCASELEKEIILEKQKVPIAETKKPLQPNALSFNIEPEKRITNIVRKIDVVNDSVEVTFYDNGIVDGDSITVKYNNKTIIQHLLITAKGKTFKLKVEPFPNENELIMYAENLGSIPPNTALMIVYDGKKRYEVEISSSNTQNGKVAFVRKK